MTQPDRTAADDRPTITPDPDRGGILLHLPEITYLDTQVWSVDIGLTDAAVQALAAVLQPAPLSPAVRAAGQPVCDLPHETIAEEDACDRRLAADRADLRDRIVAEVQRLHETGGVYALDAGEPERIADAVLAVLGEQPDRAAVLLDAADHYARQGKVVVSAPQVAAELRRLAGGQPTQDEADDAAKLPPMDPWRILGIGTAPSHCTGQLGFCAEHGVHRPGEAQRATLRERHRAAWNALTPAERDARVAALDAIDPEEQATRCPHGCDVSRCPCLACEADTEARQEPTDEDVVEAHRLALSLTLGLGTGAQWGAIRERAAELAGAQQPDTETLAAALDGIHTLIATSSRDWQTYRVDAWLWAVLCGWDCEQDEHDETCTHGALEETAVMHGWDDDTVAKARRYRTAVRALTDPAPVAQQPAAEAPVVPTGHPCNAAVMHRLGDLATAHGPHLWVVQPGMEPVHCPGAPAQQPAADGGEETRRG